MLSGANHFEINDLCQAMADTWAGFAAWADKVLPGEFDPVRRPGRHYSRFTHGFHSTFVTGKLNPFYPRCLAPGEFVMAETARTVADFYAAGESRNSPECLASLQGGFGEKLGHLLWETAILAALNRKARRRVRRDRSYGYRRRGQLKLNCQKLYKQRPYIDAGIRRILSRTLRTNLRTRKRPRLVSLRWVRWYLRRPPQHEKAFWTQLRARLKPEVRVLASVSRSLEENRPLTMTQQLMLKQCLSRGVVVPLVRGDRSRGMSVDSVMWPNYRLAVDAIDNCRLSLLVPIAYHLAQKWIGSQQWPRFVVVCRSPACGERFYSARANAKTCPRTPKSGRRSSCKAVWENYQKWLRKVGLDPATNWRDDKLQQQFVRQYRPRGSQSSAVR